VFGSDLAIPVLDLIIIIAYLLGIMFVGIFSVRRMKLTSQGVFPGREVLEMGHGGRGATARSDITQQM